MMATYREDKTQDCALSQNENPQGRIKLPLLPIVAMAFIIFLSIITLVIFKPEPPTEALPTGLPAAIKPKPSLESVLNRGKLRVLTRNTLSTYFEGPTEPAGFEYELLESYANKLGVELEIHVTNQHWNILSELENGNYDLAAANITITTDRKKLVEFGWPYLETSPQIVFRSGNVKPNSVEDLLDKQVVTAKNTYHLQKLNQLKQERQDFNWVEIDGDVDFLVRLINDGDADYGVINSIDTMTEKRLFPELRVAFDLETDPQPVAWAYAKGTDKTLIDSANAHLQEYRTYGRLLALKEKYYNRTDELDFYSTRSFVRDIKEVLPSFREYFEEAAAENNLDWQLLAAMSYQESHWKIDAVSPTGVKGIMMLTNETASDLNIEDRTDPYASIMGGAKYFAGIYNRLPDSIQDPDRLWVALAAYNIGLGHIYDVRRLIRREGKNADSWQHIERTLPSLTNPAVHETLKYGYARGNEPVTYVRNIRNYYEMLSWETAPAVDPIANSTPNDGKDDVDVKINQIGL